MNQIYRTPPTPGNVGGFHWLALFAACGAILLANIAATQYVAATFSYQSALGRPIVVLRDVRVYAPWAWMIWSKHNLFAYGTPRSVSVPLYKGNAIALSGLIFGAIAFVWMQQKRNRSGATEDIHGSARWANRKEIRKSGLMNTKHGGVYVGGWQDGGRLRYLLHNGPDHVLGFAPSRSGKGVGWVIPTLLAGWHHSLVTYDIKGENWKHTAGWRATLGPVFRFAPADAESSNRFNPLAEVRIKTEREVSDVQNIALMLVQHIVNHKEPHWHETASSMLEGMMLHACYVADEEGRVACLSDVNGIINRPGTAIRDTLKQIMQYPHVDGYPHPFIAKRANEMLEKEDREFAGVHSTAKTAMKLFEDPMLARYTSASDFRVDDLINYEHPVSLYIVVPPSDSERLRPLVRLIFTIIVARLTERMNFEGNRHRLLVLIDEFPSLKRMELFANALSYMAGYGIKAYLIAQDIRQIRGAYGVDESITSNCNLWTAFPPNTLDTAQLLSDMLGRSTIRHAHYGYSGKRFDAMMPNVSASVQHLQRPLLNADEVRRLPGPQKTGEGAAERITAPGTNLIFANGHRPIRGTQMLYFLDPVMRERAQLPPPIDLIAIEEGEVVEQRAIDRTNHVISRIEPVPAEVCTIDQNDRPV